MTLSVHRGLLSKTAHPEHRRVILARGEAMVSELAEPFAMSLPAISEHLRVLESAGLLEREKLEQWMARDEVTHDVRYTELDVRPGGTGSAGSRIGPASAPDDPRAPQLRLARCLQHPGGNSLIL